ncbi:BREX-1 system adenine-specific DNA-methyltransferase PglX [Microbispora rosea]|uniref:BREX-1 system adenine-specific DNA-methyltransferase PglX n=1 Tax=Microbispora rosea TaxID=58117 RepID=UPI0037A61957
METAPLKSFATWARTALLREVAARIAVVLAPASPERVEQTNAVAALEKAVSAAGGGETGRATVADRVAYTWFNRIIALRFMDANGYTGVGIVSPERGREGGQPEILAEAKRGNIESTVVINKRAVEAITSLLNGSRRSEDPQGEAYALLLAEYCRHWNRSMPFMFEREGDFTELLVPANLLAENSVLARAVAVLTEDVCQDVEVIGWLYQFYISERKDEVFAGFRKNKKAGAAEIPAATQLFTPHWIVRYLVENSLGRLWLLNRPTSRLAEQMEYYIAPADEETDYLKVASPEELKIIDPACGSGHMLTYAFDLLYAIYEEEGYAPSDIPGLILANNLYGTEIDPRAGALAAFALTMKARARQRTFFNKQVKPNICVLEPISFTPAELDALVTRDGDRSEEEAFWNQFEHADTFGSLIRPREQLIQPLKQHLDKHAPDDGDIIGNELHERARRVVLQADYLSLRRHVLVANPPYMDARNMSGQLYDFVSLQFPAGASGIDLAFALRSRSFVQAGGYIALLTMDSWLGNVECRDFRGIVRKDLELYALLHLGKRAFPEVNGDVVQVAASIFVNEPDRGRDSVFIDATEGVTGAEKTALFRNPQRYYTHPLKWFDTFPGQVLTPYAASETAHRTFEAAPPMSDVAEVRTGLQTGDNGAFLRYWYEVSASRIKMASTDVQAKWVPYVKSSAPTRWFGREDLVVDWADDGARIREHPSSVVRNPAYYFRSGISYGGLAGNLKGRLVDDFAIFDQKNSMVFPRAGTSPYTLLALVNSSALETLARLLSPKGFGVGVLGQLPIPEGVLDDKSIDALAREALVHSGRLYDQDETSSGYLGLDSLLLNGEATSQVQDAFHSTVCEELRLTSRLSELRRENDEYFGRALLSSSQPVARDEMVRPVSTARSFSASLVSLAVGCMFGRYSLDEPGLVLANHGDTFQDYLAKVPNPSFMPDKDNVIPIVDGDWFEDDIVARFRQFLRVVFGEQHFEENLRFVAESLGVKDLRDYFVKFFYKDHVQRYKKRPIYWLFSSPKGSFNALIYMHRYTKSTVSIVLNEYLREFKAKLEAKRQHHERLAAGTGTPRDKAAWQKEVDRLRKVLLELDEYEHDVLYPLATQQVQIDLDDGVKANYPKFGAALKKIPGLEASDE